MEEDQKPSHAERIGRVFEYRGQLLAGLDQRYDVGALCFAAMYIVAEHIWKLPPDTDYAKQIQFAHRQLDEALEATRP